MVLYFAKRILQPMAITFTVICGFSVCKSELTHSELNISMSLIDHLSAKNCIFITDSKSSNLLNTIKRLTFARNIYTTCKTSQELEEYLEPGNYLQFKLGLIPSLNPHKIVIVWKTDINQINDVLENAPFRGRIAHFDWIIILSAENVSRETLSKIQFGPYQSNFLLVYQVDGNHEILEIYKVNEFSKLFVKKYGEWNSSTGLVADDDYIFSRRFNFEGSLLILYTYGFHVHTFHTYPVIRNLYEYWTEMSRIMNYSTVNVSVTQLDLLDEDILEVSDAHLNLAAWNWITSRDVNYQIVPLWSHNVHFHIKYERDALTGLQSLLRPFSIHIWTFLGACLLVTSSFLILIDFIINKYYSQDIGINFNFIDSLFASLETLLNQGSHQLSSSSSRVLFLSTLAIVVVLMPLYTGAVVSFLTVSNPYFPFKDLSGFLNDGTYRVAVSNNSFLSRYFMLANDPQSQELYEKYLINATKVNDVLDQLETTCNEKKFAFLSVNDEHFSLVKNFQQFKHCRVLQIPKALFTTSVGMMTHYDSLLTSVFKYNWLRFQNYGMANKMKRSLSPSSTNEDHSGSDFQMISFSNVIPILVILSTGILFSGILFLFELTYFYLRKVWGQKKLYPSLRKTCNGILAVKEAFVPAATRLDLVIRLRNEFSNLFNKAITRDNDELTV